MVEEGGRSSLYASREGMLHRLYHDTGVWKRLPTRLDERGVQRCAQNRRVEALVDEVFGSDFRFRGEDGGGAAPKAAIPRHVRRAAYALLGERDGSPGRPPAAVQPNGGANGGAKDVRALALAWNVKASTAWCYLAQVAEHYPALHSRISEYVHPNVLRWMRAEGDASGSLRELWGRFDRGDPELRCLPDLFAHLRLGRLCAHAEAPNAATAALPPAR